MSDVFELNEIVDVDYGELAKPFPYHAHKWRVMNVSKSGKGSVAFYVDARDVMDRLDAVAGPGNWKDSYHVIHMEGGHWHVQCSLNVGGVTKSDVGTGDDSKDAFSDALKRAAVKFGVFRYGYALETKSVNFGWFPLDEYKNFTKESQTQIEKMLYEGLKRFKNGEVKPEPKFDTPVNGNHKPKSHVMPPPAALPDADNPFEGPMVELGDFVGVIDRLDVDDHKHIIAMMEYLRALHQSSSSTMSNEVKAGKKVSQYGLLCWRLDELVGDDLHGPILTAICGREVSSQNPPGYQLKEVIDWLMNADENAKKLSYLAELGHLIQGMRQLPGFDNGVEQSAEIPF